MNTRDNVSSPWWSRWETLALAALTLLAGLAWRYGPALRAHREDAQRRRRESEAARFDRVLAACRRGDARESMQTLLGWVDRITPQGQVATLDRLLVLARDEDLTAAVRRLERVLYGRGEATGWRGEALARHLQRVRAVRTGRGLEAPPGLLAPLNPPKQLAMRGPGRRRAGPPWLLALLLASLGSGAQAADGSENRFDVLGDFRLRLEQDWDSLQGDGTLRDDRLRLRVRLRIGFGLQLSDAWSVRVQARTGSSQSQQSPHITIYDFDGGPDGPYQANMDLWNVRYASGGLDVWAGRNELSMWHQDDLFIFDNVTYPGAGGAFRHGLGGGDMTWNLNYVALPLGMRDVSGTALVGQVVWDRVLTRSALTVAGGVIASLADPDDPAGELLLTENSTRDYRVLNLQLQYRWKLFGQPCRLGLDWSHNARDYDEAPPDSFSAFHAGDVDGYAVELFWGNNERAGDWLLGHSWAHQEALATNSSYVQDDWVRWGNANQVRATNLKGSEIRAMYTIRPRMNVFARLFFVHGIDLLEPGDATKESGNRFRIEYNVSF